MSGDGFSIALNRVKQILTDPVKLKNFIKTNKKDLLYWAVAFAAIIVIYMLFSSGDFSFFLTLSGLIQMAGFFLIVIKVHNSKSVSGLSLNTFICYAISFFARLCSILKYEGYLPYDSSGDVVYRLEEGIAFILALSMVYMISSKYRSTYNEDIDRIPFWMLAAPMLFWSCVIHPSLNDSYFGDISWTFSLYLEAVAMCPQLYMFAKKGGEVDSVTSHFVASQALSRISALFFWFVSYSELNVAHGNQFSLFKSYVGYIILGTQLLQMVLLSDFLYEYVKSLSQGLPMTVQGFIV